MREKRSPWFGGTVLLSNTLALSAVLTSFFSGRADEILLPCTHIWVPFVLACYAVLCLLLRKERERSLLVLLCLAFFAAQTVAALICGGFEGAEGNWIMILAVWAASYFRAYFLVTEPVTAQPLIGALDADAIVLAFALFVFEKKGMPLTLLLPLAAACLISLCALILFRSAGRGKNSAQGMLPALGAAVGFGAAATAAVVWGSSGIKKVWHGLTSAILAIVRLIGRGFLWLISLIPVPEETAPAAMEPLPSALPAEVLEEETAASGWVLYVLLGFLAAGVLVIVLQALFRRDRIHFRVKIGGRTGRRERIRRESLFLRLWRKFSENVRYALLCVLRRNTVAGVYSKVERTWKARHKGRRADESCREFLQRIAAESPESAEALLVLADAADAWYFGGENILPRERIIELKRELNG